MIFKSSFNFKADKFSYQLGEKKLIILRFFNHKNRLLTWLDIAQELFSNSEFRLFWDQTHANIPFDYQWKPIPIHSSTSKTQPFFLILVPSSFAIASPNAYLEYLKKLPPDKLVTSFPNLSGDAHLIIPVARGNYGHLAAFCRQATREEKHHLWQKVGELATEAINKDKSVWCNTHGHGVPWLHIRFDKTQKYTSFPPRGNITKASQKQWYDIYQDAFNC